MKKYIKCIVLLPLLIILLISALIPIGVTLEKRQIEKALRDRQKY